jgi:hypothetical protein
VSAPLRLVRQDGQEVAEAACGFAPLLGGAVRYGLDGGSPHTQVAEDDLAAHARRFGERPRATGRAGRDLLDILDEIGLSGRGGSHFPAAAKWRTHLSAGGGGVVVANGAESEPASAKDTALMQLRPHLVLDGLACAAEAVGADDAVMWLHSGAHAARSAMVRALGERRAARLPDPAIRLGIGPDHYLSGESSAIVNALSGRAALPGFTTRPAAISGVHGRPTLLHNVETLARTALAARTGTAYHAGTSLLTVADQTGSRTDGGTTIRPFWSAGSAAPGYPGTSPNTCPPMRTTFGHKVYLSEPEFSCRFRMTLAASLSSRGLPISLPPAVLASAGRACSGCARSPTRRPSSRADVPTVATRNA